MLESTLDFERLSYDEYGNYCRLVNWFSKKGYQLAEAQAKAYQSILADGMPFWSLTFKPGSLSTSAIDHQAWHPSIAAGRNLIMFVEWKDEYSIGVELLDGHHRKLIELLNKAYTLVTQGDNLTELSKLLNELINYAHYHFTAEEEMMHQYQCENIEKHEMQHIDFIKKIIAYKKDFSAGGEQLSAEVFDFMTNWLLNHILKIDMEMGKEMCSKQGPG
jgi:hemerythrin